MMIIVILSQINRGINSRKTNLSNNLYHEARNAAESWSEYGCADVIRRFESKTSFPENELKYNPITVPSAATEFYSGSNLDMTNTEVKGGQIEPGYWLYLDKTDPRWEYDPLKGKRVFVRDISIYAKATTVSRKLEGRTATAYIRQTIQVRDNPLFSHAVFYNLDLEMNPGPNMDIFGTVHSNRDAWIGVNDGSYLKFHSTITASGRFFHGDKQEASYNPHRDGLRGDVYMMDANNDWQPMKLDPTGDGDEDWLDSKHVDWRHLAIQTWDGNVQDEYHNVPTYNAAGISDYIADDPNTIDIETENHAYAIIEPLLPMTHADAKTESVRNQKMMAKAGLIFKVEIDSTTFTGLRIRAYKWRRYNTGIPVNVQLPFDGNLLIDTAGNPTLQEITIPDRNTSSLLASDLIGVANSAISEVDNTSYSNIPQVESYMDASGIVTAGLFDHRQDMQISLITLDVGLLRKLVDNQANVSTTNLASEYFKDASGNVTYDPKTDWNGVVYVMFPMESPSGSAADSIVRAAPSITVTNSLGMSKTYNLGLQLINAEYVPSPSFSPNPGFTLATNAPLYVIGHYNADGLEHPNDAQEIETSHYKDSFGNYYNEPPSALMADTITLLSTDWTPSGKNNRSYSAESDKWNRTVVNTNLEVSAALLTGVTPTIPRGTLMSPSDGANSGGAINLPRFLEHWNDHRATLRTSLVALFESEVHTEPMHDYFNHFFIPPVRDWGYNENFENGIYPPGTPNVRAFRRTRFEDISATQYKTGVTF